MSLILAIRTEKPEAEIYLYEDSKCLAGVRWAAHRQLAETLHSNIDRLLDDTGHTLDEVRKIVVFQGPGSFTGLRIGISVANAFSYSLGIPIVGASGDNWINAGIEKAGTSTPVSPEYGSAPHITQQKK